MTLLGPPYFVYPCKRLAFVFVLEFLGMANLCPSAVTLITMLESLVFSFGIYFRGLVVRSFDSSFIFLSFSFVMNVIFIFTIFLAGRNYK